MVVLESIALFCYSVSVFLIVFSLGLWLFYKATNQKAIFKINELNYFKTLMDTKNTYPDDFEEYFKKWGKKSENC